MSQPDRLRALRDIIHLSAQLADLRGRLERIADPEHEEHAYWLESVRHAETCGLTNLAYVVARNLTDREQAQAAIEGIDPYGPASRGVSG